MDKESEDLVHKLHTYQKRTNAVTLVCYVCDDTQGYSSALEIQGKFSGGRGISK